MLRISMSAWTAVVLCLVAPTVIACGNSDDGSGSASTSAAKPGLEATRSGSDEAQIRATLVYAGDAMTSGDGRAFCGKLSRAGRRQYMASMTAWGRSGTCGDIVKQTAALGRAAGRDLPAVTVAAVTVTGDQAVTKSKGGLAGRSGDTLRLVREDGEWKLSDLGLGGLIPSSQNDG